MKRLLATGFASTFVLGVLIIPSMANAADDDNNDSIAVQQMVNELDAQVKAEQELDPSIPTKIVIAEDGDQLVAGNEALSFSREIITIQELQDFETTEIITTDLGPVTVNPTTVDPFMAKTLANDDTTTIVSLDIPFEFDDGVSAIAAPPPEPEPEPEPVVDYNNEGNSNYTPDPGPVAPPPAAANSIVETALQYVGYPYVYGASGPNAFDCSGFTSYIYAQHDIYLPRTSYAQSGAGRTISASEAMPGDLVISNGGGHVMIYLGDGMVVHASTPATGVKVSPIWGSHWFVRVNG